MKIKELRTKSEAELHKMLSELRTKVFDLRFKTASNQLKNVRELRQAKKTIAKILTLLKQPPTSGAAKQ